MIGIIDYGGGNVLAFVNVLERLGHDYKVIKTPRDIKNISGLIFPGVGSWDATVRRLHSSGLWDFIIDFVQQGRPLLGVCLGMQILLEHSDEGNEKGLGLIPGKVKLLPSEVKPHMGWNILELSSNFTPFSQFHGHEFYHIHSYYCDPDVSDVNMGRVTYEGNTFPTFIQRGNLIGCQFHPEKSHNSGEKFINEFVNICYAVDCQ